MGNLFQSNADFSKLTNDNITVGEGVHKAKIVINEQGAQAAAATAIFTFRMMADEDDNSIPFVCNRPFIFLIYNKETHTLLFTGIFRKPSSA